MYAKHYFVCGHTAKGFRNLFTTNIKPLKKVYILLGGPCAGQHRFMMQLSKRLDELPYTVEYAHCSSDPDSYDAILIPELGIGIIDGTPPHISTPTAPGAVEEYINLSIGWNVDQLSEHKEEITELQDQIQECYEKAYVSFASGLKVHDEWEKIYIENMNFTKANQLTEMVIQKLLGDTELNKSSCVQHRFFGGSTSYGPIDFVENITEHISTRYFIKGRPGSGKSTMLKKVLDNAIKRGIDVEVYHCGFDPDSLDMLLFPELNLTIFDSTSPHEYYPSRIGDIVIDMYALLINPGTDERYEAVLEDIISRYKMFTKEGTSHLAEASHHQKELIKLYLEATDLTKIDVLNNELFDKILKIHEKALKARL